ncbi:hypothetical protein FISHEDRAFT_70865 [Fistulina hepatica ATCC 64428]|uniref:Uncharacterized protein n=1 Tax=Fistulina hepatica ATCC 64428 TaxID=1128425 RepID=A0A0D7AI15_9AGAR|nr:hypothetical protein FISHEDRAFT_70865 [Fistulina hepatica ATCC 64428]
MLVTVLHADDGRSRGPPNKYSVSAPTFTHVPAQRVFHLPQSFASNASSICPPCISRPIAPMTLNPGTSTRPSLPASSSDFALPTASSSSSSSGGTTNVRRSGIATPKSTLLSESRTHSPLATSFTPRSPLIGHECITPSDESESDRDKIATDTPPSSGSDNNTPLLAHLRSRFSPPATPPPRRRSSAAMDFERQSRSRTRRLTQPVKQPRILRLLAESRPFEELETSSESAFTRLASACSDLPSQRRQACDRGRFPEEVACEDSQPSDDEDESDFEDESLYHSVSAPIPIGPSSLAAKSSEAAVGTLDGSMDVDVPSASSSVSSMRMSMTPTTATAWRHTPPSASGVIKSNKRKLEDRYEPYPKRRAVSPSVAYVRDGYFSLGSPGRMTPRLPIVIPSMPGSACTSASSSPTFGSHFPASFSRAATMSGSPTIRAAGLASPILRPVVRSTVGRHSDPGDEREIDGAGEAVLGLSIT